MIITLTGYYGYKNYGDDLMLLALVKNLLHSSNNIKINIISKSPLPFFKNEDRVRCYYFKKSAKFYNILVFFKAVIQSKILVWGGGTCFTNEDGVSIRYFLLAKLLNKKIGYIGIGVGNINGLNKLKTKIILQLSNIITVRDSYSFLKVKKLLNKKIKKLFLTADLTYLLDFKVGSNKNDYILISLHNLKRYFPNKEISLRRSYLLEFIKKQKKQKEILIMPLCEEDYDENILLFNQIKNTISTRVKLVLNEDPEERTNIISAASLYYTERLHGFIVAYFANTPCIPLKYSKKFDAFIINESIKNIFTINQKKLEEIKNMELHKKPIFNNQSINKSIAKKNISLLIKMLN